MIKVNSRQDFSNFPLIEKYCNGVSSGLAVYFDRIEEENIVLDPTIIK